jgi:anti-sigma factor RsiW
MHALVMENLEEYLSGTLKPEALTGFEAHLRSCGPCREEVAAMREMAGCFQALRCEQETAPVPGFYGRVMQEVGNRQAVPSFAGFFALDFAFGRRLVFASLLMLALLGSYLVSHESGYGEALYPEAVMAQQESPAYDRAAARDNMLATLTAYEP